MKILVDTCVIIDAIANRRPFDKDAQALLLFCARGRLNGYITANSLTDIHFLLSKTNHDETTIRNIINNMLQSIKILDTTSFECKNALYSEIHDFEDAIQAESARNNNIDLIVTRNLKDYKRSPVPACSPADCLKKLGAENWG